MVNGTLRFRAEQSARQYLEMRGFEVTELNFRRSKYLIDAVAQKHGAIYFVKLGIGNHDTNVFDMVTPSQSTQMRLAAASWIEEYEWQGPIHYSLIEMDAGSMAIMNFTEDFI